METPGGRRLFLLGRFQDGGVRLANVEYTSQRAGSRRATVGEQHSHDGTNSEGASRVGRSQKDPELVDAGPTRMSICEGDCGPSSADRSRNATLCNPAMTASRSLTDAAHGSAAGLAPTGAGRPDHRPHSGQGSKYPPRVKRACWTAVDLDYKTVRTSIAHSLRPPRCHHQGRTGNLLPIRPQARGAAYDMNVRTPIRNPPDPMYAEFEVHRTMICDRVRTEAFWRAIDSVVRPGNIVLDVGAGSGILSVFAAWAGAGRVYAVERTSVAVLAQELAAANGVAEIVQVIHGDVMDVELPEPVDVIVSEWLGGFGIDEGMLAPVIVARDRWLKPGGVMIPGLVTAWVGAGARPLSWGDGGVPAGQPVRPEVRRPGREDGQRDRLFRNLPSSGGG